MITLSRPILKSIISSFKHEDILVKVSYIFLSKDPTIYTFPEVKNPLEHIPHYILSILYPCFNFI
jgi:hypothetical protein